MNKDIKDISIHTSHHQFDVLRVDSKDIPPFVVIYHKNSGVNQIPQSATLWMSYEDVELLYKAIQTVLNKGNPLEPITKT